VIVVDASALVDVLTGAPGSDAVHGQLAGQDLQAPALLDYEVVSALRGLTLGKQLSVARASDALTDFEDLALHRWQQVDQWRRRAFELRHDLSAYDAAYVVLAEALGCRLVTRDARLARARGHSAQIDLA
jgi:predicted nucleic acid-binding protein